MRDTASAHYQRRGGRCPVVDGGLSRRSLPPHLATCIDIARRRQGLSIRRLAERTGISNGMAGYLCSAAAPQPGSGAQIAEVLHQLPDRVVEALLEVAAVRARPDED